VDIPLKIALYMD